MHYFYWNFWFVWQSNSVVASLFVYCPYLFVALIFSCSLASIRHLDCLGLSDNRLTAISLPTIIENISYSTLLALDLSFNNLHETGAIALANYFKAKTVLQDMDLSHCHLTCSDIKVLCNVLCFYNNRLEEWRMSCNAIAEEGIVGKCVSIFILFFSLTVVLGLN